MLISMTGDSPIPGFYQTRLVKAGPFVGVKVWFNIAERDEAGDLLEDEGLMMLRDGELVNPYDNWVWCMGNEITEAEYNWMIADSDHAKQYRPEDAKANPRRSIDLANSKSVF